MNKVIKIALWTICGIIGIPLLIIAALIIYVVASDHRETFKEDTMHWKAFSNNIVGTWNIKNSDLVSVDTWYDYKFSPSDSIVYNNYIICFSSNGDGYYEYDNQRQDFTYSIEDYKKYHIIWLSPIGDCYDITDGQIINSTNIKDDRLLNSNHYFEFSHGCGYDMRVQYKPQRLALFYYNGNLRGNKIKLITNKAGYIAYMNGLIDGYRFTIKKKNNNQPIIPVSTTDITSKDSIIQEEVARIMTPEPVDLGLSVKWASFNLGASSPEEYGNYYAWGETEIKCNYSENTYKWYNGFDQLGVTRIQTKYCLDPGPNYIGSNGVPDDKTLLDPEDDVAQVKLGGKWRMPTKEEFKELFENCDCVTTTYNEKNVFKLTSKKNGNSIYIPATGFMVGSTIYSDGFHADYWTSSLCSSSRCAWGACFDSNWHGLYRNDASSRHIGQSVRPVLDYDYYVTGITTGKASEINISSAKLDGKVSLKGEMPGSCSKTFFLYSQTASTWESIQSSGERIEAKSNKADIYCMIENLYPGTMYYYVACITVGDKILHGKIASFKTHNVLPPDPVDLGLSVKWASCNLGAPSPEDYGNKFAWGETMTKSNFSIDSYKWAKGNGYTKYCMESASDYNGFTDNKTVLDLEDDAAHAILGGSWRMPTKEEFNELIENCNYKFTTYNEKPGFKFISKKNGNSIFFPCIINPYNVKYGNYWTSSLNTDDHPMYQTMGLSFELNSNRNHGVFSSRKFRYEGLMIRPVSE